MRRRFYIFLLVLLLLPFAAAKALESPWYQADYVQARLLSGTSGVAGFEIKLEEGWHAYWRMPGDGGLPPAFDWSGSKNMADIEISWPVPERFEMVGLYSFGYKENVILPLKITAADPDKPVMLDVTADIMICKDICVPQKVALSLNISAEGMTETSHAAAIEAARETVPKQEDLPGLKIENIVIGPDAVVANIFSRAGFERFDLFVEAGDLYVTAPPEITVDEGDPRKALVRVAAPEGVDSLTAAVLEKNVTLTATNGRYAVEKTISF